jgi:DNA-binding transcriptional MerR regulator
MLRLQQILFYRELGFPLGGIGPVLDDPAFDLVKALRGHRVAMRERIERCADLIATIDRTIDSIEKDYDMNDDELYAGIAPETRERWEREAREHWGEEAVAEAEAQTKAMPKGQIAAMKVEMEANQTAFAALTAAGADPASDDAQAVVRRHYRWVCNSWTPNAAQFAGLGRLMVEHPEFRATYESAAPGCAAFMAEAMAIFAEREL